jgi:hypothetical protein
MGIYRGTFSEFGYLSHDRASSKLFTMVEDPPILDCVGYQQHIVVNFSAPMSSYNIPPDKAREYSSTLDAFVGNQGVSHAPCTKRVIG